MIGRHSIFLVASAVLTACFLASPRVQAQGISAHASVSHQKVPQGGRLELRLAIEGTQQADAPQLSFEGFEARYLGPSTQISIVNGQMSSSITYVYVLTAKKEGVFTLGPISVNVNGETISTQPIEVTVGSPSSASQRAEQPDADAPELGDDLQLTVALDAKSVYVNQEVPLKIQLLIGDVPLRGVEMPRLQVDGVLIRPIGKPVQSQMLIGAKSYNLLEFPVTIVPIRPGSLMLGSVTIKGEILQRKPSTRRSRGGRDRFFNDDFFDNFFTHTVRIPVTVRAEPVSLEVLPLPSEGQSESFSGAVGQFTLKATALPSTVALGDPITLIMTVQGQGNQDSVSPPRLMGDLGRFKIYDPQPRLEEEGSSVKMFEQVLIPMDEGIEALPLVQFSYFDPFSERYVTREVGPIPIQVTQAAKTIGPAIEGPTQTREVLGRDIIYIKSDPGRWYAASRTWYRFPAFWIWLIAPFLILGISESFRLRRERLVRDPAAARASAALKSATAQFQQARRLAHSGKIQEGYAAIHRAVQRYVGDRLNLPSESLTKTELEQRLAMRKAPADVVRALAQIAERCDTVRFAPGAAAEEIEETISMGESSLRQLERWRPS